MRGAVGLARGACEAVREHARGTATKQVGCGGVFLNTLLSVRRPRSMPLFGARAPVFRSARRDHFVAWVGFNRNRSKKSAVA